MLIVAFEKGLNKLHEKLNLVEVLHVIMKLKLMFLVRLFFEGQDLCSAKRCTGKGQICVVNNHNQAVCQCRESCPRPGHQERVCGSDGITYKSRCILDRTSCKLGTDITVDSNRCKGMTVYVLMFHNSR